MNMETVLKTSLAGAALILLVLGLRIAVSGRISRKWIVLLWDIALLRLLTPWFVEIPVYQLAHQTPLIADTLTSPTTMADLMATLFWIWCCGAATTAAMLIRRYAAERSVIATSVPISLSPEEAARCRELLPDGHAYRIYVSQRLATPVAAGIIRPRIVLPAFYTQWDDSTLRCALIHEAAHLKSNDILHKLVMSAATVIHWFNPLAWLMASNLDRDLEAACDERAIRLLGNENLREYANTLLDLQAQQTALSICTAGFGTSATKERICLLLTKKKCTAITVFVLVLISVLCTAAFAVPVAAAEVATAPASSLEVTSDSTAPTSDSARAANDTFIDKGDYLASQTYFTIDTDTGEIKDENGNIIGQANKMGKSYFSMDNDNGSMIISVQAETPMEDGSVVYTVHEENRSAH